MQNNKEHHISDRYSNLSSNIDFNRVVRVLLSRWYWIIGAILLASLLSYGFLKLAKPRYVASALLRFNEKKSELAELNQLIEPNSFVGQEYLTEKFVIESEEVINRAIASLDYPFTFYKDATFHKEDVYPYKPFSSSLVSYDPQLFGHGTFELQKNGIIKYISEDSNEEQSFDLSKDTLVAVKGLSFKVKSIDRLNEDYSFTYNDLESVKKAIDDKIRVEEHEQNLPIIYVHFTYYNKKFTQDFLDNLVKQYEAYNLEQKQKSSNLTIKFIRDQLNIYSSALRKASSVVENYKQRQSVPSLASSMTEVMGKMSDFETQKNALDIQKSYINLLEQNLTANQFEPINIGSIGLDNKTDGVLLKLISDLNKLILDRKTLLVGRGLSINNPTVKAADDEIERVRQQIFSSIKAQRQNNDNTLQLVNQNLSVLQGRLKTLPSVERELIYLENDRAVNEKIYLLLLNKEIEASIVSAGILPSFNVLSRTNAYKVYPKAVQVIMIGLFAGLIIGIGSIFLTRYFNNTFTEISKIGQNERVYLAGVIQRYPEKVQQNKQDLAQFLDNRSLFAESVNGIRTNLSFLLNNDSTQGKLITITSEISGEGKSFITLNLAISLTKTGKRVLIIVSDLRRSKLHRFFNNNNKVGLSNYLSGKAKELATVIHHSDIKGLDFIPAGPIPFNPTELIQNEQFEQLIADCKKTYDYVLIDTAPVGLVSDNIPLLRQSDLVIFVVRWLYSHRESYLLAEQLATEYGIKAVGVIINDFYQDDLYADITPVAYYASRGYGYNHYKYGYNYYGRYNSYHDEHKPSTNWQQKITTWVDKLKKIINTEK